MTSRRDMEKRGFLRTQGWKRIRDKDWLDLHPGFEWGKDWWIGTLDFAYARASRRKAQRERAALKKAGFEWSPGAPAIESAGWSLKRTPEERMRDALDLFTGKKGLEQVIFTRAEALKQLGIK